MSDIRLLVFDLDGTALGGHVPYAMFPPDFVRFLDGLAARNIRWATNTTWSPDAQFEVVQRSGVTSRPAFLTGATGRLMGTIQRGKLKHDDAYEKAIVAQDKRFKTAQWPRVRGIMQQLLQEELVDRIAYDAGGHNMFTVSSCRGCRTRVWALVEPLIADGSFYSWHPGKRAAITLLPHYMNKGAIVGEMQRRLGVGPEHTLVAGDGVNDLQMFTPAVARYMVCPANAEGPVKQAVRRHGGIVAKKRFCWGVMEGAEQIIG